MDVLGPPGCPRDQRGRVGRIFIAQAISRVGDQAMVILMMVDLQRHAGTAILAQAMAMAVVPTLLAAPVAGSLGERWGVQRVVMTLDLCAMALLGASAALYQVVDRTALIMVTATLLSACSALAHPNLASLLTLVAGTAPLQRVFARLALGVSGAGAVGAVAGAVAYERCGAQALLLLDALTFALSAVALWSCGTLAVRAQRCGLPRMLALGFAATVQRPGLRAHLVASVGLGLVGISWSVLLPAHILHHLGGSPVQYSLVLSATGVGGMAGSLLAGWWRASPGGDRRLICSCLILANLPFLLMAVAASWWQAALCAGVMGTFSAIGGVRFEAVVAQRLPHRLLASVTALRQAIGRLGMPLGMLVAGWAAGHASTVTVYALGGGLSIAIATLLVLHPPFRQYLQPDHRCTTDRGRTTRP